MIQMCQDAVTVLNDEMWSTKILFDCINECTSCLEMLLPLIKVVSPYFTLHPSDGSAPWSWVPATAGLSTWHEGRQEWSVHRAGERFPVVVHGSGSPAVLLRWDIWFSSQGVKPDYWQHLIWILDGIRHFHANLEIKRRFII